MESRTDELAARLLRCPVGCAFLLTIERDQVPVALAVTPPQAFARAAAAVRTLDSRESIPPSRSTVEPGSAGPSAGDYAAKARKRCRGLTAIWSFRPCPQAGRQGRLGKNGSPGEPRFEVLFSRSGSDVIA